MRSERAFTVRLLAVLATCAIAFAACGGGDDDDDSANSSEGSGEEGGTIVDYGTFVADPPAHIDPALNNMVDAYTVVNALYDGLTELDTTDPAQRGREAARRGELGSERRRDRVCLQDQRRLGLLQRRGGATELVRARVGARH